ncbi:hypothetical protein [Streptomyces viridosporus]|uniref:hypothetical protein n=1 Tax=Streptomyces viridosporus TaxID=67581 RepID=UPI003325D001
MNGIDWGNVPTWFSAIGTTLSVAIALKLVFRDRADKQTSDARRVVVRYKREKQTAHPPAIRVINTADRPISDLLIVAMLQNGPRQHPFALVPFPDGEHLAPGEECEAQDPRGSMDGMQVEAAVGVAFVDADGRGWIRRLDTSEIIRRKIQRSEFWPWSAKITLAGLTYITGARKSRKMLAQTTYRTYKPWRRDTAN